MSGCVPGKSGTETFLNPNCPGTVRENREQRLVSVPIIRELSGKVGNRDFSQSQLSGNCPGKLGTETGLNPNYPGTVRENREQRLVSIPIIRELSGKVGNRDWSQSQLSGNCPGKLGTETGLSPDFPDAFPENQEQRLFSIPIIRELSGKVGNIDWSQSGFVLTRSAEIHCSRTDTVIITIMF